MGVDIIHESSLILLLYCLSFSPGSVLTGAGVGPALREWSIKLRPRGTANGRERADAKIRCTWFLLGIELTW